MCNSLEVATVKAPVVIKPNDDGSSIDISICRLEEEIDEALQSVLHSREEVLVEKWVDGREITVGIIDGEALPVIEIIPPPELSTYDYEAKYLRDDTQFVLNPSMPTQQCVEDALLIYQELGVSDLARVDFIVNDDGGWFLEVNTMPGFTDYSLLPLAAKEYGLSMPSLCQKLVQLALHRSNNFA